MSSVASEKTTAGPPAGAAPRPPARRRDSLNLSRRPFLNSRPVVRTALALWLLGLALLLGNVSLFWSYLSGSKDKRAEIAGREAAIAREREAIRQLEARLASFDLEQQNERIDFLNRRIAERTFSWSLLFDRIAEVLPNDVRLQRLTPATEKRREAERLRSAGVVRRDLPPDDRVSLTITGVAKTDEVLDQFVNRLFDHPSFGEDVNPTREVRDDETNYVAFEITVSYIPGGPPQSAVPEGAPPVVVEEETPAPGGAPQ
jgi:hypothetical protein